MTSLTFWNDSCCSLSHTNNTSFVSSERRGLVISDRLGANLAKYVTIPNRVSSSLLLVGGFIAETLSGSGSKPFAVSVWPKYFTFVTPTSNLSLFNLRPRSRDLSSALRKFSSCSCRVFPCTMMSSTNAMTPSRPSKHSSTRRWNSSCDDLRPNGSLRYLYLPKGVLNVVSNDESLDNFIVQYPERASSLVKYWAPASLGSTSSNARGG